MSEVRLLPLLMIAAGAMLCLRTVTLVLGEPPELGMAQAHAQAAEQAPEQPAAAAQASGAEAGAEAPAAQGPGPGQDGTISVDATLPGATTAATAIEESLSQRRQQLEARAADLDLREKLLVATQQRVEERIAELEAIEKRVEDMLAQRKAEEEGQFASIIGMYGKMKPKDAARILNGLELPILQKVATGLDPRQMSEILANMEPAVAQQLTTELSAEPPQLSVETAEAGELPKIVGTRQ